MLRLTLILLVLSALFYSCGEESAVQPVNNETVLYEQQGLVDSAVVYGCYAHTVRHFVADTFSFAGYSKVKIMFDGLANSDGTVISVLYNTDNSSNVFVYNVTDEMGINKMHTFEFEKPSLDAWFEVRFYINPPVCGTGEFKFTRARDLKIIGIK